MSTLFDANSERALILAPQGRDAQVAADILREDKLTAEICRDLSDLVQKIIDGAGLAVMTDDVIRDMDIRVLAEWVRVQAAWSDFPLVVLTERGAGLERNPVATRQTEALGNVVFLERPFHPTTFISVVQTALRGRRRQYEARARLEALHESEAYARRAEASVRSLNETLEARVGRDGPMPFAVALQVIEQAARALAVAEVCGVVHRDIKPSNIMLESDPSETLIIKVIDYGVAKVMGPQAEAGAEETRVGFIGTPAFASPEQFIGAWQMPIDTRSDIYSLGVTLWYLLTGRTPFVGRTMEEIRARQTGELPLEQLKGLHLPGQVVRRPAAAGSAADLGCVLAGPGDLPAPLHSPPPLGG